MNSIELGGLDSISNDNNNNEGIYSSILNMKFSKDEISELLMSDSSNQDLSENRYDNLEDWIADGGDTEGTRFDSKLRLNIF